jgi:G3E family GTPase
MESSGKERVEFRDEARVPLHVISGFLGSGKTTFLQAAVDYTLGLGLKPAIMINEYGEVSIDGELLRGRGFAVKELTNGCICCTLGGNLALAIKDVVALSPDVIFVEATGLADPVELLEQVTREEVLPLVRTASLISILDPLSFARLGRDEGIGVSEHTAMADLVVVNKRDLADDETLSRLVEEARRRNPRAEIVTAKHGRVDFARVLARRGEVTPPPRGGHSRHVHDHFHTLTYVCDGPFSRRAFVDFMGKLPRGVWRAKGFVRFDDSEEQWMFQFASGEFAMEWVDLLPEPPEHVIFIGSGFDRDGLVASLSGCLAGAGRH